MPHFMTRILGLALGFITTLSTVAQEPADAPLPLIEEQSNQRNPEKGPHQPLQKINESTPSTESEPVSTADAIPPIFPFWQKRFDGDESWLKAAGYSPRRWTKPTINLTQEAPFADGKLERWIRTNNGGVAMLHFKEVATEADEDRAIPELRRLVAIAEESNVQMVIYPYFGCHIDTAERALHFLHKVDQPSVGLTLHLPQELRNGNASRLNDIITKVIDKIALVVVCGAEMPEPHDDPAQWEWHRLIKPLDEGDFDWASVVKALRAAGYKGSYAYICWQFPRDTKEYLTASMIAWKSKLQ